MGKTWNRISALSWLLNEPDQSRRAYEESIKRASQIAAEEILALTKKDNPYERTLIEITVARTLRGIMEGSVPVQ